MPQASNGRGIYLSILIADMMARGCVAQLGERLLTRQEASFLHRRKTTRSRTYVGGLAHLKFREVCIMKLSQFTGSLHSKPSRVSDHP
jgi:hypothetical protein